MKELASFFTRGLMVQEHFEKYISNVCTLVRYWHSGSEKAWGSRDEALRLKKLGDEWRIVKVDAQADMRHKRPWHVSLA